MSKILIGVPYLEGTDISPDGTLKSYVNGGKPVVMMVQGNFCGYCNQAKPAFQKFCEKTGAGITIQIDGGKTEQEAAAHKSKWGAPSGVPAFIGFNSSGRAVKIHDGGRDEQSLINFLESLS